MVGLHLQDRADEPLDHVVDAAPGLRVLIEGEGALLDALDQDLVVEAVERKSRGDHKKDKHSERPHIHTWSEITSLESLRCCIEDVVPLKKWMI